MAHYSPCTRKFNLMSRIVISIIYYKSKIMCKVNKTTPLYKEEKIENLHVRLFIVLLHQIFQISTIIKNDM